METVLISVFNLLGYEPQFHMKIFDDVILCLNLLFSSVRKLIFFLGGGDDHSGIVSFKREFIFVTDFAQRILEMKYLTNTTVTCFTLLIKYFILKSVLIQNKHSAPHLKAKCVI